MASSSNSSKGSNINVNQCSSDTDRNFVQGKHLRSEMEPEERIEKCPRVEQSVSVEVISQSDQGPSNRANAALEMPGPIENVPSPKQSDQEEVCAVSADEQVPAKDANSEGNHCLPATSTQGDNAVAAGTSQPSGSNNSPTDFQMTSRELLDMYRNASDHFSHLIVFLPSYELKNGRKTSPLGEYKLISMATVMIGSRLTDWSMEMRTYRNRWRTVVKPVEIREQGEVLEASLFCRIRKMAPMPVAREIVVTLNHHLDRYRDHIRRGIAEEWNAQEQWRVYPSHANMSITIQFTREGRPDVRQVMKDLIPQGYDPDWEM